MVKKNTPVRRLPWIVIDSFSRHRRQVFFSSVGLVENISLLYLVSGDTLEFEIIKKNVFNQLIDLRH